MKSGFFGSLKWGPNGEPRPDFNPIENPVRNWKLYHQIFKRIVSLERVAMANFIPWGSANMKTFMRELGTANPPLLQRGLEFADELNIEIVAALRPRLMVIPLSLVRTYRFVDGRVGVSLEKAIDVRPYSIDVRKRTVNFYTGACQRGKLTVRAIFLPHPASLHLSNESRKRVSRKLGHVLQKFF